METIYFTTSNFIRHEGNVVDFTEYRRKLAVATATVAPVVVPTAAAEEAPVAPRRRTPRRRTFLPGLVLDCAASLALIITALTFTIAIL